MLPTRRRNILWFMVGNSGLDRREEMAFAALVRSFLKGRPPLACTNAFVVPWIYDTRTLSLSLLPDSECTSETLAWEGIWVENYSFQIFFGVRKIQGLIPCHWIRIKEGGLSQREEKRQLIVLTKYFAVEIALIFPREITRIRRQNQLILSGLCTPVRLSAAINAGNHCLFISPFSFMKNL